MARGVVFLTPSSVVEMTGMVENNFEPNNTDTISPGKDVRHDFSSLELEPGFCLTLNPGLGQPPPLPGGPKQEARIWVSARKFFGLGWPLDGPICPPPSPRGSMPGWVGGASPPGS